MASSAEGDELFYLKWNNFQMNINNQFERLRSNDELVDITFACEGRRIGAHRLILFACSPYFKDLLKNNTTHSVFYMYGVRYEILRAIIEYMYLGEVHINNENLHEFIKVAESLQIRGLTKDQAVKIPKPVMEVNAHDLISSHHDHLDHSVKRVVRRGGKRMRSVDGPESSNEHHIFVSNETISVDVGGVIGDVMPKGNMPMPKIPESKHPQYPGENQVEPKLEMDDSVDISNYCGHNRGVDNHHQQHPHQLKPIHPQQQQQQQQQPQQQLPNQQQSQLGGGPQQQQSQPNPHLGPPPNAVMIEGSYDRPSTSHGNPPDGIKTGFESITESSNQSAHDENKFKTKREGTPKLTKCQESSRACPVCSRIYSSVSNLRQHMRLIHNPTYVCCPICQKYFNTDLYLRRHISGIHRGENIDWPPPYESNTTTPNSIC